MTLLTIALVFFFIFLVHTEFKTMFWIGIVSLYIQSLTWTFRFQQLIGSSPKEDYGLTILLFLSIIPFPYPAILALLTGVAAQSKHATVISFSFFSMLQVLIHGKLSSQEDFFTNLVETSKKLVIPILSFFLSLVRLLLS